MVDPIRVFIKNEPHKKSKLSSGFLRLISNVSVLDEIIDRLLFGAQNQVEIDNWFKIPSKPGIGFTDEMMQLISREVFSAQATSPKACIDFSSHDWTVQEFQFWFDCRCRIILAGLDEESIWARLIRNRFYCVMMGVFVLSDGSMFAQLQPGLIKSGWLCTGSSSSRIVRGDCVLSGVDWSMHMGDDLITDLVPGLKESLTGLGKIVKFIEPVSDSFEFCSTIFPSFEPKNVDKIFVKLLSNGTKNYYERLGLYHDWLDDMRHSPRRGELIDVIHASGFLDYDLDEDTFSEEEVDSNSL